MMLWMQQLPKGCGTVHQALMYFVGRRVKVDTTDFMQVIPTTGLRLPEAGYAETIFVRVPHLIYE